ncbi:MAG: hypothetical protein RLZZ68_1939, partial [Bacteroidota bacterium]
EVGWAVEVLGLHEQNQRCASELDSTINNYLGFFLRDVNFYFLGTSKQ